MNKMKKYPSRLTADEWNLLQNLTTYNHMDCWFELRDGKKYDYGYDRENGGKMKLRDAIGEVADGLYNEDLKLFRNGVKIWDKLMEKFSLDEFKYCKN